MTIEERIAEKANLDQIRETMGISVQKISRLANLSAPTIYNYQNNVLSERTLRDYRKALEDILEETNLKVKEK